MSHDFVALWIDHKEARIFHIDPAAFATSTVMAPTHHLHKHPKSAEGRKEHPDDMKRFFDAVVHQLEGVNAILVLGPSTAKLHLLRYLREHAPNVERRVVGAETVDHPTDGQLVAYARQYFATRAVA